MTTPNPARVQVEQKILGLLLAYPETLGGAIESGLNEELFTRQHQPFVRGIVNCFLNDLIPTPALVSEVHASSPKKREQSIQYLNNLIENIKQENERPENLSYYYSSLKDHGLKDRIASWAEETVQLARSGKISGVELQHKLLDSLFSLDKIGEEKRVVKLKQGLTEYLKQIRIASEQEDDKDFLTPTGFRELDRYFNGGFRKSSLVYIAARPGNCKTTTLLNMALNAAYMFNIPAVIFSFEMALDELLQILLSMITEKLFPDDGVPSAVLQNPKNITLNQWDKLVRAVETLQDIPLWVEDCDGFTTHQLEAKVIKYAKMGVDSFYIDYWQLIRLPNGKPPREEADYNETSEALRRLAKKVNGKIIAAAQVNRQSEGRDIKQPTMRDIRSSGKAEMDAHRIITLHYPDQYVDDPSEHEFENELHLAIVKNRRGRTGKVILWYKKEFGLLEDIVPSRLTKPMEEREPIAVNN